MNSALLNRTALNVQSKFNNLLPATLYKITCAAVLLPQFDPLNLDDSIIELTDSSTGVSSVMDIQSYLTNILLNSDAEFVRSSIYVETVCCKQITLMAPVRSLSQGESLVNGISATVDYLPFSPLRLNVSAYTCSNQSSCTAVSVLYPSTVTFISDYSKYVTFSPALSGM